MPKSDAYDKLIKGYRDFRMNYLNKEFEAYREWASHHQNPKTLIIGCSDSRVNPAILTHAGLGEIFAVNNVANIVPPYNEGENRHMSLGAAIQYAVMHLHVEHIIVMGHSECGGIAALMQLEEGDETTTDYIKNWVSILKPARDAVLNNSSYQAEEQACLCEMEAVLLSLQNLAGYPWVRDAVEQKKLTIHGWYFHIESGELLSYVPNEGRFRRTFREK